jgi:hypothetical protein
MKPPRQFSLRVTLEASDGTRIVRPVTLTDVFESNAKHRAGIVAAKPGQKVVGVEVAR